MTPERWQEIEDVLDQVEPGPVEHRVAQVDRLCAGNKTLRQEVEEIIVCCEQAAERAFLEESPLVDGQDFASLMLEDDLQPGEWVESYCIVGHLDGGGMGDVYLAERTDPHRQVALKVVKRGMDTREILRRFHYEQEILARLEHSNIARLYDAGITGDGRPYFAMEYVEDGQPLDAYCDEHNLSVRARLELFTTVCEAVRYAHRNLVVHRDLKPGNILVSRDEAGQPKVKLLDFGIAKLLKEDATLREFQKTEAGSRIMTRNYAAPEQIAGGATTTATDVYALGIILYKLLTGRRPYYFDDYSVTGIERVIRRTIPERPSTVVVRAPRSNGTAEATPEALSQQRAASPKMLRRQLKGDLDAIILMALRKEPERRYASAGEFLDDIQRYLGNRPVVAQPDSVGYRASKFVQRHRVGVSITAAVVVLITTLVSVFTTRLADERDRANLEAKNANDMLDYVVGMFEVVDPDEAQGRTISARDLVDMGLLKIERLEGQPLSQAVMMDVMGTVSFSLGYLERSDSLFQRALVIRRQELGEDHPDLAESLYGRARALQYQRNFEEATALYRQALDIQRQAYGEADPSLARYINGLAHSLYTQGASENREEAETLFRQAMAIGNKELEEAHPDVLEGMEGLADLLAGLGELDEAEQLYRQVVEIRRETLGEADPLLADAMFGLAECLRAKKDLQGARAFHYDALQIYIKVYGEQHNVVAESMTTLAILLVQLQDYQEAEHYYRKAAKIYQETLPPNSLRRAYPLIGLGGVLVRRGEPQRAEEFLRQGLDITLRAQPREEIMIFNAKYFLGNCLAAIGRYEEAQPLLTESYLGFKDDPQQFRTQRVLEALVTLYEAWQKPDSTAKYRALLEPLQE